MTNRRDNWQGMNWIRQEKRLAIYLRDNFTCQHCGLDLQTIKPGDGIRIELDHIDPVSRGGTNEARNLVTSCSKCNLLHSDNLIQELWGWMRLAQLKEQATKPLNVHLAKQVLAERKSKRLLMS